LFLVFKKRKIQFIKSLIIGSLPQIFFINFFSHPFTICSIWINGIYNDILCASEDNIKGISNA